MWKEGAVKVNGSNFKFWVKVYNGGSQYGIDGGQISKLMLKRSNEIVCNYDRGWDIQPIDKDTEIALEILKKDYN